MQKGVGIDLGTATLKIATKQDGLLAEEPSILAVDKHTTRILAIGNSAAGLPAGNLNAVLVRPFTKGLLHRKSMLRYMLTEIRESLSESLPAAIAVSPLFSETEATELFHLCHEAGFSGVALVPSPTAALIGSGITTDTDCIILDLGASETAMTLFLDGRVVHTETLLVGGNSLDRSIIEFLESDYHLRVSPSVAEAVKIHIGAAWNDGDEMTARVSGNRLSDGGSELLTLTTSVLMNAFEETVTLLVESICALLRRVPLTKVESLFRNGIFLTGGTARLRGLDRLIGALTGVQTTCLPDPDRAVVRGLAEIASLSPDVPEEAALLSRLILYRN